MRTSRLVPSTQIATVSYDFLEYIADTERQARNSLKLSFPVDILAVRHAAVSRLVLILITSSQRCCLSVRHRSERYQRATPWPEIYFRAVFSRLFFHFLISCLPSLSPLFSPPRSGPSNPAKRSGRALLAAAAGENDMMQQPDTFAGF